MALRSSLNMTKLYPRPFKRFTLGIYPPYCSFCPNDFDLIGNVGTTSASIQPANDFSSSLSFFFNDAPHTITTTSVSFRYFTNIETLRLQSLRINWKLFFIEQINYYLFDILGVISSSFHDWWNFGQFISAIRRRIEQERERKGERIIVCP